MKIGIIGLGLIGGSILKNFVETEHKILAVTRNQATLDKIRGMVYKCSSDYEILSEADAVFVCTPIHKVLETLDKLENIVSKDCAVTDVASVKTFVTQKKRPYNFIPSHPMAGTENSGYDSSFKELFQGAKWVITPFDSKDYSVLQNLIDLTGAKTIVTTAKEHDKAVALISHMPMYISQCLFDVAKGNKLAMQLASSGFRDTTRLAMTDLNLAKDMLSFNGNNINECLSLFQNKLKELKSEYNDEKLSEIKDLRHKMYSKDGKNIVEIN